MSKFSCHLGALALLAGLALGCSKPTSPLVGIWTREVNEQAPSTADPPQKSAKGVTIKGDDSGAMGMSMYLFGKDGGGKITEKGNSRAFTWEEEGQKVTITYDTNGKTESVVYNYTVEEGKLTLTPGQGEAIVLTHITPPDQDGQ